MPKKLLLLLLLVVFSALGLLVACLPPDADAAKPAHPPHPTTPNSPPPTTAPPPTTEPPTTTPPTTAPPTTAPPTTAPPTTAPPTTTTPPTPPPTGSATFFSASSAWNTPLPASTTWHDNPSVRAQDWFVNYTSYSNPVFIARSSDPVISVSVPDSWGWPGGTLAIHIPVGAGAAAGTDQSVVIIDGTTAYDFWLFQRTGTSTASAGAYGRSDIVSGTGWGTASPFQGAGIRAAGSSGLGGEIYGSELTTGFHHALAIAAPGGFFCGDAGPAGYVPPAIYNDGSCEGVRVGIPASTPMPGGLSLPGQNLWRALQTYGAYNVDTVGGGTVILNADPNSVPGADLGAMWGDLHVIDQYVRVVN